MTDQSKNSKVFEVAHARVEAALAAGMNVIFDSTALCRETRKPPIEIGRKYEATIIAVVMNTPLTVAIERNRAREHVVPSPVIWKQQGRFYPPTLLEVDQVINIGLNVEWPHWKPKKK